MQDGQIRNQGTYDEIKKIDSFQELILINNARSSHLSLTDSSPILPDINQKQFKKKDSSSKNDALILPEERIYGKLSLAIWKSYLRYIGG